MNPAVSISLRGDGKAAGRGLTSPEIERLRDAWFEASDLAERQRICRTLQEQAWQDVPFMPIGQWKTQSAWRTSIIGLPQGIPLFWGARPS